MPHTHIADADVAPHSSRPSSAAMLDTYGRHALAGAIGAACMHSFLIPLDVIKTTHQLRGSGVSAVQVAQQLFRQHGIRAFLTGATPTLSGYAFQGGFKFGVYEVLNDRMHVKNRSDGVQFAAHLGTAACAELVASTFLCPFEAARIRLVAGGYGTSLVSTLVALHHDHAFFRGWVPLVLKQLPYTTVQLAVFSACTHTVYDRILPEMKRRTNPDGPGVPLAASRQLEISMACGAVAGVVSSIASQPGDTILTRMNAAAKKAVAGGAAHPSLPSLGAVVRELGWKGLWLGTGTRAAFTAVLSAGMFLVLDTVKLGLGLPTSH